MSRPMSTLWWLLQDLRRTANGLQLHLDPVSGRWSMLTVRRLTYSQVIVHASGNCVPSTRWVPQGSHAVEVVSSGCFRSRTSLSISTDAIHNPSGYKGLAVNQWSWTLEWKFGAVRIGSPYDFGFPVCARSAVRGSTVRMTSELSPHPTSRLRFATAVEASERTPLAWGARFQHVPVFEHSRRPGPARI